MHRRNESQGNIRGVIAMALWVALAVAWAALHTPVQAQTGLAYSVEIEGVEDSTLRSLLHQSSQLVSLRETPPATLTGIRRRAREDLDRLGATLRSEGYYGGRAEYAVDGAARPVLVRLILTPGERFRLRRFDIAYASPVTGDVPRSIADFAAARGQPATGRFVLSLQGQLIDQLHDNGYPFAEVADRVAEAHMADARLEVDLAVDPGPMVRFGETSIINPTRAVDDYIHQHITWRRGDPFSRQKLRDVDAALEGTGLFSNVTVEPGANLNADGSLDVRIVLAERHLRTVGLGLRFGTSEGAGGRAYWEHRNLLGRAERLRLELEVAEIRQIASVQLRQPGFMRSDQDLLTGLSVFNVVAESYDETGFSASAGLTRQLSRALRAQAGVEARISVVDEGGLRRDTRLLRFPVGLTYDTADDILDPARGIRTSLTLTPTVGDSETSLLYLRSEARAAAYYAVDEDERIILAARTRVGTITGEGNFDLPASERFYAGGGGSVRGIGYQLAGPVDASRDPIGGRSVFEIGAEARLRVTDRIGIVPFIEGGSVFTNDRPDLSEDLRWGAGVGLRYYTPFGPLRIDVATPINRRDGIDDVVQFYISLGQAF